jgi:hypothetical protein
MVSSRLYNLSQNGFVWQKSTGAVQPRCRPGPPSHPSPPCFFRGLASQARHELVPPRETIASRIVVPGIARNSPDGLASPMRIRGAGRRPNPQPRKCSGLRHGYGPRLLPRPSNPARIGRPDNAHAVPGTAMSKNGAGARILTAAPRIHGAQYRTWGSLNQWLIDLYGPYRGQLFSADNLSEAKTADLGTPSERAGGQKEMTR